MKNQDKKILLMILDGYGEGKAYRGNAILNARKPNIDRLRKEYPVTFLKTNGSAVGLPKGTMGGSEVGHFTIGAGRVVFQTLDQINDAIHDGSFFRKKEFLKATEKVKKLAPDSDQGRESSPSLHLIGMISDAGVHSHLDHLFALMKLAKKQGLDSKKVYIHAITDGRDVHEKSAKKYLRKIQKKIAELGIGNIATITGRFYAMDRDKNWNRTQKAYDLYTLGKGHKETDPLKAIDHAYKRGDKTDYYIQPIIMNENGLIKAKDSVINFNFRSDRAQQITTTLTDPGFKDFKRKKPVFPFYVCFGPYSKIAPVAFPPTKIKNNLGEIISKTGAKQLRVAETEKFAHVTFFFNSQIKKPYKGENRLMIPSPKVPSYDLKPEMSARKVTTELIKELKKHPDYKLIVLNFANADLVGHAGDYKAALKAIEVIDECVGKVVKAAREEGYDILITGDHGNSEYMIYEDSGEPCPAHTMNKVPCILVSDDYKKSKLRKKTAGLKDVAPTILKILKIKKPSQMTGESLIA